MRVPVPINLHLGGALLGQTIAEIHRREVERIMEDAKSRLPILTYGERRKMAAEASARKRTKVKRAIVASAIRQVAVRANVMVGQYQSLHVELVADVAKGQDYREVTDDLATMVADELSRLRKGEEVVEKRTKSFADRLR